MFCVHCGKQISDESKFCVHCGKSRVKTVPVQAAPAHPVQPASPPPPPKKSGSAKPVILGIIIALIVAIVGIGGYYAVTEFVIPAVEEWLDEDSEKSSNEDPDDAPEKDPEEENKPRPGVAESTVETTAPQVSQEEPLPADNPYWECFENYADFVLPGSDNRYYCYEEISHLSDEELTVAYQEIFARFGDTFVDDDLQAYFEARDWYYADSGFYEFNSYEHSNVILLRTQLDMRSGDLYISGNPYIKLYRDHDYVIPTSNSRYITFDDISRLSKDAVRVIRSEILARHGCIFEDMELQEYFCSKPWYRPSIPESRFNQNMLNHYESENIAFIDNAEKAPTQEVPGAYWSPDNPYKVIYERYGRNQVYFFPDSSTRLLSSADIAGMNIDELCLARNEIWARNGYLFGDDHLREYFQHFTWYHPTTAMGDQDAMNFNSVEYENIRFLRARQSELENG